MGKRTADQAQADAEKVVGLCTCIVDLLTHVSPCKARAAAEAAQQVTIDPTADPLYGMRVHAWVLVCPGQRGVPEAFFIGRSALRSCEPCSAESNVV